MSKIKNTKHNVFLPKKGGGFKKVIGISLITLAVIGAVPLLGTQTVEAILGAAPLLASGAALIAADKKKKKK